jgi:plasmid stabilization system protein ParE
MALKIIWSKRALNRLNLIMDYLKSEWSPKINREFLETVDNKIETLSLFPFAGKLVDENKNLREYLLTEHSYIVYRVTENSLHIINIKDTRQNSKNGN